MKIHRNASNKIRIILHKPSVKYTNCYGSISAQIHHSLCQIHCRKTAFPVKFWVLKNCRMISCIEKKQQNQNGFGKCILKAPHGKWFCNYWPDTILLFSHFALHKKVSIIADFHLITRQYRGCV